VPRGGEFKESINSSSLKREGGETLTVNLLGARRGHPWNICTGAGRKKRHWEKGTNARGDDGTKGGGGRQVHDRGWGQTKFPTEMSLCFNKKGKRHRGIARKRKIGSGERGGHGLVVVSSNGGEIPHAFQCRKVNKCHGKEGLKGKLWKIKNQGRKKKKI